MSSKSLPEFCPNSLLTACTCTQEGCSVTPFSDGPLYSVRNATATFCKWLPDGGHLSKVTGHTAAPPFEIYIGTRHPAVTTHTPCNVRPALSQALSFQVQDSRYDVSKNFYFKNFCGSSQLFLHRKFAGFSANSTLTQLGILFIFCNFLIRNNFKLTVYKDGTKNSPTLLSGSWL